MKDIKRRSFLKSVFGGLTALFVGVPKAKAVNPNSKVRWRKWAYPGDVPSGLPGGGLNEVMLGDKPWTDAQTAALMEGDQWTDEQIRRMVAQHNKTMDELCINVIKDGTRR